jgi:hypothetical protein
VVKVVEKINPRKAASPCAAFFYPPDDECPMSNG